MSDKLINNTLFVPDVPFHQDPLLRNPKQQSIKQNIQEINLKLILILKKIHLFKKESCQRCSKDWTSHFLKTQRS